MRDNAIDNKIEAVPFSFSVLPSYTHGLGVTRLMLIIRTFKRALSLSYVTYSYTHLYINYLVMSVQVTVTHMRRFPCPMPEVSIQPRGPLRPKVTTTTLSFCFTRLGPPRPRASLAHITYVCPGRSPSFRCL